MAWEILKEFSGCFLSCADFVAANGIRILANPLAGDDTVKSGESGAVGIGLLDLLVNTPDFKELTQELQIDRHSSLLFLTPKVPQIPKTIVRYSGTVDIRIPFKPHRPSFILS